MKLNNKGIGLIEVLAASLIISIVLLSIIRNIINLYEINTVSQRRNTAYNIANQVYNILGSTHSLTFEDDITPVNLVQKYNLDNCNNSLQKIMSQETCVNMLNPTINDHEYKNGDIFFYVYVQDQNTINTILNNPDLYHKLLVNRANEIELKEEYDTSQVFRVSIIVKYGEQDNYTLMVNGYLRR